MFHYLITQNGRSALALAMRHFFNEEPALLLVPAFMCNSAISLVETAGYEIVYFDINKDLTLSVENISQLILKRSLSNVALLAPHYFGITQKNIHKIRVLCNDNNIKMIEDHCHSFLNVKEDELIGDAAITTMRKSIDAQFGLLITTEEFLYDELSSVENLYLVSNTKNMNGMIKKHFTKYAINPYNKLFDIFRIIMHFFNYQKKQININDLHRAKLTTNIFDLIHEDFDLDAIKRSKLANYNFLYLKLWRDYKIYSTEKNDIPQCFVVSNYDDQIIRKLRDNAFDVYRWPGIELPKDVKLNPVSFPIAHDLQKRILCLSLKQMNRTTEMIAILTNRH